MKISLGILMVLLDCLIASLSIHDNAGIFKYSIDSRRETLLFLQKQLDNQQVNIDISE